MFNKEIREKMRACGVRQWQVAECMNISESLLSKMMRHELDPDMAQKVYAAISRVVENSARAKAAMTQGVVIEK